MEKEEYTYTQEELREVVEAEIQSQINDNVAELKSELTEELGDLSEINVGNIKSEQGGFQAADHNLDEAIDKAERLIEDSAFSMEDSMASNVEDNLDLSESKEVIQGQIEDSVEAFLDQDNYNVETVLDEVLVDTSLEDLKETETLVSEEDLKEALSDAIENRLESEDHGFSGIEINEESDYTKEISEVIDTVELEDNIKVSADLEDWASDKVESLNLDSVIEAGVERESEIDNKVELEQGNSEISVEGDHATIKEDTMSGEESERVVDRETALNEMDKAAGVDSDKVETKEETAERDNLSVEEKEAKLVEIAETTTDKEVLDRLADTDSDKVQEAVANNENTSEETREKIESKEETQEQSQGMSH